MQKHVFVFGFVISLFTAMTVFAQMKISLPQRFPEEINETDQKRIAKIFDTANYILDTASQGKGTSKNQF